MVLFPYMSESFQDHTNYPGKPRLFPADQLVQDGNLVVVKNRVRIKIPGTRPFSFSSDRFKVLPQPDRRQRVLDPFDACLAGLEDYLIPGSLYRQAFEQFREQVAEASDEEYWTLGYYVYTPRKDTLSHIMPEKWHRLSLVVSNGDLYQQKNFQQLEIRARFDEAVIAVIGASVGSVIARSVAGDIRPKTMKIADNAPYKLANANRVPIGVSELGINKAVASAQSLNDADPFMNIHVYPEGVTARNIDEFLTNPQPDVVIEESDNPLIKLLTWEAARRHQLPLIMATDAGSVAQLDIPRFDLDPEQSIALGLSDSQLHDRQKAFEDNPTDTSRFIDFATALIGTESLQDEFAAWIYRKQVPTFARIPQLSSTVSVAAGFVSEAVAQILLGRRVARRSHIDKRASLGLENLS